MAYRERKGLNFGTCHYHLCKKRTKVHRCKYCKESFCSEHLKAKPPGLPRFSSTKHEDRLFMEEWSKKGGHPCMPYLNYWEQENKRKEEEYGRALDRVLRTGYKEHKAPKEEEQSVEHPKSHQQRRIVFPNIFYRINYWLNKRNHYPYDYSARANYILRLLLWLVISFVSLFLFYTNITKLNEITIWIIQLGGTLVLISLFFSIKYSYKVLKELMNWFKRQRNWLKYLIILILIFLSWQVYSQRDTVFDPAINFYKSINFTNLYPIKFGNFSLGSDYQDDGPPSYKPSYGTNWGCSVIQIEYNYKSSEEDSKQAIDYLNKIRKQNGKSEILFDKRVFELAVARAKDMREYNYLDHTNPYTGTCPDNMKTSYGISSYEYVAENAFGNPQYSEGSCTEIQMRPMTEAIDDWMTSRGHRYNLLYDTHIAGAVGCYKNMCTFLGLNRDRFGEG